MRMNVNKIIRYSMQLAILKQLKLKNMITEEEYEKILRSARCGKRQGSVLPLLNM